MTSSTTILVPYQYLYFGTNSSILRSTVLIPTYWYLYGTTILGSFYVLTRVEVRGLANFCSYSVPYVQTVRSTGR